MMPLLFGKFTNIVHKLERLPEIGELEGLRDMVFFDDRPAVHLRFEGGEFLAVEGRDVASARDARFGG